MKLDAASHVQKSTTPSQIPTRLLGCACPLTVQHIMIDCVEFAYTRTRFVFRCQKHERSLRFVFFQDVT